MNEDSDAEEEMASGVAEGASVDADLDATVEGTVASAVAETAESGAGDAREKELAELNDRYLRLAADFDNYRKRMIRERAEAMASANEDMVLELLPVVDNLERAVSSARSGGSDGLAGIAKGVELTLKLFQGLLGRHGVERMSVVGEAFDPHRHDALMQEESEDVSVDTVGEELEPGYTMRGKVVRPARVKVRRAPGPAPKDEGSAEMTEDTQEEAN